MAFPKIVGIIPARINSSRFPRKLLHILKDKTVLQHTIEKAKTFSALNDLFLTTDNLEIAKHAENLGVKVIMTSSQPLTGTDRVAEAVLSNIYLQGAEIIFNLQADHPFTTSKTIDNILEKLIEDPFAEIGTAASPLFDAQKAQSPDIVKCVFDHNHNVLYFSRSPIPHHGDRYYHHIGIYAFRRRFLQRLKNLKHTDLEKKEDLEQLRFLENGVKIKVAITDDPAQGIDSPKDILTCENLLCR